MTATFESVVGALGRVERHGSPRDVRARCPICATTGLAVRQRDGEPLLITCHTCGAGFRDVLDRLGNTWVERTPASGPGHRQTHTMAFDSTRGRVVLFGGYDGGSSRGHLGVGRQHMDAEDSVLESASPIGPRDGV